MQTSNYVIPVIHITRFSTYKTGVLEIPSRNDNGTVRAGTTPPPLPWPLPHKGDQLENITRPNPVGHKGPTLPSSSGRDVVVGFEGRNRRFLLAPAVARLLDFEVVTATPP